MFCEKVALKYFGKFTGKYGNESMEVLSQQIFFENYSNATLFYKILRYFREYKNNFDNLFNEMNIPLNLKQTSLHIYQLWTSSDRFLLSFPQTKV